MKNVSKEFREKASKGAMFYQTAKIVFADGRQKELGRRDFYMSGNCFSDGTGVNTFPLGEAMSKHITLVLVNDDDRFSDYDFYMAQITVWLKCDLSETTESILIGTYTVTTPETYGSQVTVDAIDDMYKGNEEYVTNITYPASLITILRDSCLTCGVNLLSTSFSNDSFIVKEKPEDITHRQLWGMIAMIAGGNARMDEYNRLEIKEYDFSYFEKTGLDGGYFDAATPYVSGDNADGGNFTDWSSGDSYDGGSFEELNSFHMFYRAKVPTMATDDVVITGIMTTIDEESYLFGDEGYVLKIENQLIVGNPGAAVELIGTRIVGLRFRPFTMDHKAYPLAEFGDLCYIADGKGNVYQSVVTDVSFNYFGYTTISCSADDPIRNSSKYYSSSTEAIVKARKNTKKQLSEYDLAVQQLTNLITNSFGVFKTEERKEDGSVIYYLHDKNKLSSSKKIWKMTADAFAVSSDGGKTWNAGLDNSGNAVVNVLSAIGINANWILAGLLSDKTGKNKWNLDTGEFLLEKYPTDDDVAVLFGISENGIMSSVAKQYETKNNAESNYTSLSSSITQNAINISTKVEKGSVCSEINQSAEQIVLRGNRVIVESDKWKANADGSQTCSDMNITGGGVSLTGASNTEVKIAVKNIASNQQMKLSPAMFEFYDTSGNNTFYLLGSVVPNLVLISSDGVYKAGISTYGHSVLVNGATVSKMDGTGFTTNANLTVSGTKARKAETKNYGERLLFCYETPTPMFGDIGEGLLDETGKCYIFVDDIFSETIDTDCSYQVFLQPYGKGECYVSERNALYFIVEGTSGLSFGWELKAVQKDYDTMRLEEFEELEMEENTIIENEMYLYSLINETDVLVENESYLELLVYQESENEK